MGAGSSTPTAATSCSSAWTAALLEPRLPPRIFYNLMLAARKPGVSPAREHPPGPFDMLRDKRAMVDTTVAPIAFVIVYAITKEVNVAAAVAVGIGIALFVERLVRRKPVINAIGGLFGDRARRVHRRPQRQRRRLLLAARCPAGRAVS